MRGPALFACVLTPLLAAAPAAAEVVVAACADVGAGVEVSGSATFDIEVQRDPTQASAARLDTTVYDPDNLNGGYEVSMTVNPAAYSVPNLQSLTLGQNGANFDRRSVAYSIDLPLTAVVQGANSVVITDNDTVSEFKVERICLTLVGAPPPSPPPASEIFCAGDVLSPDPTQAGETFNDGQPAAPGDTATFDVDVYLSDDVAVGLLLDAYVSANDSGAHTGGFSSQTASLTQAFVADNDQKNDQYLIVRAAEPSRLLVGGSAAQPTPNALTAQGTFDGHYWSACLVVEDSFTPPVPDAGPPPDPDAGPPTADAGEPLPDAGADPIVDAGGPAPVDDAGAPVKPTDDAGGPPTEVDAGLVEEPASDAGRQGEGELPADDEALARAELTDPSFSVSSTCAGAGPEGPLLTSLALLALLLRRRRRAART